MCINYQTSLGALLFGEIAGLILIINQGQKFNDLEKIFVGLFVMFYSLIQLCELQIYLNIPEKNSIYNKLLVINLAFQGLLFFVLMSWIYKINGIYLMICGLVSLIILLDVITNSTQISFTNSNCLKWDFINRKNIYIPLGLMYCTMFFWIFVEPNSNFIKYIGLVLLITFIFSYFLIEGKFNSPGLWCLSSAIAAPLFLLFE